MINIQKEISAPINMCPVLCLHPLTETGSAIHNSSTIEKFVTEKKKVMETNQAQAGKNEQVSENGYNASIIVGAIIIIIATIFLYFEKKGTNTINIPTIRSSDVKKIYKNNI